MVERLLEGVEPVGFAWIVLVAFGRLSTRRQAFGNPLTPGEAFDIVEDWLARPNAVVLTPTARHVAVLRAFLEPLGTAGNLTNDAHLAALAIEYSAQLCSADSDFSRFPGLRWSNPLT